MVDERIKIFSKSNILVGIAIAILTISLWAYANRPEKEPPWPKRIQGFSFSPMRADQDPVEGTFPSPKEIEADLALLSNKAHAVRTYSLGGDFDQIPGLAKKYKLNVTLGAWLNGDLESNEAEINKLIDVANANQDVIRVIVGNEAVLRGDLTVDQVIEYMKRVKDAVHQPVSTAEPWHVWVKFPQLAENVDFLAVHMLPYWEGVHLDVAVDYVVKRMEELQKLFPDKPVIIAEVGWPSNGRTRGAAVASPSNEATFLRRFLNRAEKEKYIYYVMEAFDQPWKRASEGSVGAYWGVYDADRKQKFPFTAPIVAIPNWYVLAGISVLIAAITLAILLIDSRTLRTRGRSFLGVISFAAATVAVWIVYDYIHQYLTVTSVIVGILMLLGMIGVIIVILTEAHEWAEALWVIERRRSFQPVAVPEESLPKVSVHVATYNEPPDMVIETLNALAMLDYPRFEVIVIDNNTKDPDVWQPVEKHCAKLGERFRFFHVDPIKGFKAGALNFGLKQTAQDAEIIGVIDSDYIVDKNWLRDLVPQFVNPKIAIVQAPQDYRDSDASTFKSMCYAEYSGFFFIGMVTRNERNAIIQHGTMTLVRKSILIEVGAWSEWCICEDAELGLRVFEHGYEATYIAKSYGRGLMPDTFIDFKKQRFRWAYGAVQILKRHARILFGREKSVLTRGQKYHFIAGWLPWVADAANLLFNISVLAWALAMMLWPKKIDPPMVEFMLLPLVLFVFKIGKLIYLYRHKVKAPIISIFAAALAGISLSHVIAQGVLQGFFTKDKPFFRTPKKADSRPLWKAISSAREELLFMVALLLAAWCLSQEKGLMTFDMRVWIFVLIVQATPYFAAVVVSIISGFKVTEDK